MTFSFSFLLSPRGKSASPTESTDSSLRSIEDPGPRPKHGEQTSSKQKPKPTKSSLSARAQKPNGSSQIVTAETRVMKLRERIRVAEDALNQLDHRAAGIDTSVDQIGGTEDNSLLSPLISLSVDRHLADLQSTVTALSAILENVPSSSVSNKTVRTSSSRHTHNEHPRCASSLATPGFSHSFTNASESQLEHAFSAGDDLVFSSPVIRDPIQYSTPPTILDSLYVAPLRLHRYTAGDDLMSSSPAIRDPVQYPKAPTILDSPYVAPLRLPARSASTRTLDATNNRPRSTPRSFEREIHVRRVRNGKSSHGPSPQTLGHSRSVLSTPCRDVPQLESRPTSLPAAGSSGIPRRQFSTEHKTQRLRSLNASSSRPWNQTGGESQVDADSSGDSESLRVDELWNYLRAGNSMRDL